MEHVSSPAPPERSAVTSGSIELDRGTMPYVVKGPVSAPWALILPGAFTAPWLYESARDHLARTFRVITLEYRGVAGSRNDLRHITPELLARDTLDLLDQLAVTEVNVACISLGTFVLAELLHLGPRRIAKCAIGGMPALRRRAQVLVDLGESDFTRTQESPHQIGVQSIMSRLWSDTFRKDQAGLYREVMTRVSELTARDVWAGAQRWQGVFAADWTRRFVAARAVGVPHR